VSETNGQRKTIKEPGPPHGPNAKKEEKKIEDEVNIDKYGARGSSMGNKQCRPQKKKEVQGGGIFERDIENRKNQGRGGKRGNKRRV